MSDRRDGLAATLHDEFERRGRKAGAELRTPAPPGGGRIVERTGNRRRAIIATIVAGAMVAIIATILVIARRDPQPRYDNHPDGTWRAVHDSPLAPKYPSSAVWTGSEAVVLGSNH